MSKPAPRFQIREAGMRVQATWMRGGIAAGNVAVVIAALTALALAPTVDPLPSWVYGDHGKPGEVGEVVPAQVMGEQAMLASEPPPDSTGQAGSGGRLVAYHSGGKVIGRGGDARLFRTRQTDLEPSMGISPSGDLYIDASIRATIGPVFHSVTTVLKSTDGGSHWVETGPKLNGQASHQYTEDGYLYVDPRTGRIFHNDLILPCQETSISDDAGRTWTDNVSNCDQADHQNLFAGPAPQGQPRPTGYPNVVYDCAINGGALATYSKATSCDKSLDGGKSFQSTGSFAFQADQSVVNDPTLCDGATGDGFVDRVGTLYLPRGWCGQPWLAISHDEGATWKRVQIATNGMDAGDDGPPDHLPSVDHEAAAVVDRYGNIYYLWVAHNYRPYLAISRNAGRTWSKPIDVAPPGVRQAALPAMAVAPSAQAGHLAIAFIGSTNAPHNPYPHSDDRYANATWNGYLVETADALSRNPIFYGGSLNATNDPVVVGNCAPVRCQQEYDFIDVEVSPKGQPYVVYVDGCDAKRTCTSLGEGVVGTVLGGLRL